MMTSTKLYIPVVTLSINDNIRFFENIKQGFKRTISWNKYRSEITTHPTNNNLDYLIDPTFRNIKGALSGLRQFLATESLLKRMKNVFYFTSKAIVLKIFKFLS